MKEEQSCLFHVQAVMRQLVGMQKESIGDLDESTAEGLKGLARRLGYLFPE